MTYPKQTLKFRPRRGVSNDLPPFAIGGEYFTQADNIVFRQGVAERAPSEVAIYDPPSVAPYHLLNTQIAGVNYWIYAGATASYAVAGTTHTAITHAGGQQSQTDVSKLTLTLLNGVPIFNNALDEPMYWDGQVTSDFVDLPGWTASETCAFIVPFRFHLFAFNMNTAAGEFPEQVKWSDAAAPGNVPSSWTAAATNEAGDAVLSDTPGAMIGAANLRGSLAIYKESSTHLADYIGGEEIFAFKTVYSQSGALTRHGVADIGRGHVIVTDGDIVFFDGVNLESIAQNRRRRYLFNNLDQENFNNLFVTFNREQKEVWICYPESGATYATRAMVWDIKNDAWGDRELKATGIAHAAIGIINDTATDESWDADSGAWDDDLTVWNEVNYSLAEKSLVLADNATPDFLEVGAGTETRTSTLSKQDIDFGHPERFKFLKRIHIRIEADSTIDFGVRIGTRNGTGESISYTASRTVNSDEGYINVSAMGKYITVEVTATTDKPFKITGLDLEAELRGYH